MEKMEITRVNQEELRIRFVENPSITATQEWIDAFRAELTGHEKLVRIDLTALDILSSLGVNVVVGVYHRMEKQGGQIRVEVSSHKTRHVFELFKLTDLFEVSVVES